LEALAAAVALACGENDRALVVGEHPWTVMRNVASDSSRRRRKWRSTSRAHRLYLLSLDPPADWLIGGG